MRIAIGSDHAGFDLKEEVKAFLAGDNQQVLDVGTSTKIPWTIPTMLKPWVRRCATPEPSEEFSFAAAA